MIKGKLVNLRELREEDLGTLKDFRNELFLEGNFRQFAPLTMKDQERYWCGFASSSTSVVFVITAAELLEESSEVLQSTVEDGLERYVLADQMVVGEVRLGEINWRNRWAMLGLMVGKEFQKRGYGSEALFLILDYAFKFLGLHCVRQEVCNDYTITMLKKFGFEEIGRTKGTTFLDGEWYEDVILEVYDERWTNLRSRIYGDQVEPRVEHAPKTI